MMAAAAPSPLAARAWPRQLHPYTRNLIRWRAQHLAAAARQLHNGELAWEYTTIPRYPIYDSRTVENPRPSASPRLVPFKDKKPVAVPAARTVPFEIHFHVLILTPGMLSEALELMDVEGVLDAWFAYLGSPHPPTIYRAHSRDGIVPTDEVRFNGSLRTAVGVLGWIATRREELGGNA